MKYYQLDNVRDLGIILDNMFRTNNATLTKSFKNQVSDRLLYKINNGVSSKLGKCSITIIIPLL